MTTDVEAVAFVQSSPREPADLRVALEDARLVAAASQEIPGGKPGRTGTGDENAVA
jgi:hypothetical protein